MPPPITATFHHSEGRARVERKLAMHGDGDLVEEVAAAEV